MLRDALAEGVLLVAVLAVLRRERGLSLRRGAALLLAELGGVQLGVLLVGRRGARLGRDAGAHRVAVALPLVARRGAGVLGGERGSILGLLLLARLGCVARVLRRLRRLGGDTRGEIGVGVAGSEQRRTLA